ncbi:dienelactone hydrolase family protein [Chitinivorax sp. B]|uniref:dienelactone hydrolase family protein n=1 Tax=Chitinivorax sp. B TaxID=2502235 RepID=UPI001485BAD9|nr:dienelactone hydrolase family protein [Chitinivorax sp. B]
MSTLITPFAWAADDWVSHLWFNQNNYHYVSFKPQPPATPVPNLPEAIGGRLMLPKTRPAPAVLILHGSYGVDSRTVRYAEALRRAGFVTLEADIWQAMGITNSRPRTVHETMPSVWGALNYLVNRPDVDPQRIGVLGFSWGAVQSMLAAREPVDGSQPHFSAFAAMYPICWGYNRVPGYELTQVSGPVQIGIGDQDDYDEGPGMCQALAVRLDPSGTKVRVRVYRNSYHGFDRWEAGAVVNDPFSHLGKGGDVMIKPNLQQGTAAIHHAVQFLRETLKP